MNDDIVARLRLYANASIDGGWASVFRADLNIAADEIERLRAERDEARRKVCEMSIQRGVFRRVGGKTVEITAAEGVADMMQWDCFKEEQ
jgi:hypothetical protein